MSSKFADQYLVGFYGWKRKCLLFTLSLLLIVTVVNLGLTLWMLKVLRFSSNGLGALKIIPGGIQLRSEALILDKLIASKVSSRKGQPIQIESSRNISLLTTSSDGRVHSRLFLGDDRFDLTANSVKVADPQGKLMFSADKREVVIGADVVQVTGEGGTVVHGMVQTPLVKPNGAGQNLTLESPTRSLNVVALHGVNLESRAGEISVQSLNEIKFQSKAGVLRLDAPNIYLPKMQVSNAAKPNSGRVSSSSSSFGGRSVAKPDVFQVCICGKGRLFLAPAEGPCVADNDVCR